MAGDWIKMRVDLSTSPKVVRIASALRADRLRVIGGLHAVWCLFDVHSEDGLLDGYTLEALDETISFPGFSAAMVSVGWLVDDGKSLSAPRFDEHNGQSAKRRAMETERKRESRKVSAVDADKMRSREEKRREDKEVNHLVISKLPTCPQQEILSLFAEHLQELPQPRVWDGARAKSLQSRWKWVIEDLERKGKPSDKQAGLDFFGRMFGYIRNSDFLMGRGQGGWTGCNLAWIVKAENFAKIIEGQYENKVAA